MTNEPKSALDMTPAEFRAAQAALIRQADNDRLDAERDAATARIMEKLTRQEPKE